MKSWFGGIGDENGIWVVKGWGEVLNGVGRNGLCLGSGLQLGLLKGL